MKNRNKIYLLGNLGQVPEVKYTPSGTPVARLSVATNRNFKDKTTNEWTSKTTWHTCIAFGRLAEVAKEKLSQGQTVDIEGRMEMRTWEDKEKGGKQYRWEVIVDDLRFFPLGTRGANGASPASEEQNEDDTADLSTDEIPF